MIHLLGEGRLINLAAAEGTRLPSWICLCQPGTLRRVFGKNRANFEKKVYDVPEAIDREIARLKLASMNVSIDTLTEAQVKYLNSWQEGT